MSTADWSLVIADAFLLLAGWWLVGSNSIVDRLLICARLMAGCLVAAWLLVGGLLVAGWWLVGCWLVAGWLLVGGFALRVLPAETRLTVYRRLLNNTGAGTIA